MHAHIFIKYTWTWMLCRTYNNCAKIFLSRFGTCFKSCMAKMPSSPTGGFQGMVQATLTLKPSASRKRAISTVAWSDCWTFSSSSALPSSCFPCLCARLASRIKVATSYSSRVRRISRQNRPTTSILWTVDNYNSY